MTDRLSPIKRLHGAILSLKKRSIRWRLGLIIAVAILTAVLVLVIIAPPGAGVLARVNGEQITQEDLRDLQIRYFGSDAPLGEERRSALLEVLIAETVLFQQAEQEGYALSMDEAELELTAQLALRDYTIDDLRAEEERRGLTYEQYLKRFRRELAIDNYVEAAINVTEEDARELYEGVGQEFPDIDLPPFELVREGLVAELQERALRSLIDELKQSASIKVFI